MTRVLVTNDDGVASPGLAALARVALDAGLEVTVAAPNAERSGSGAALSALEADGRLLVDDHPLPGLDGVPAVAVDASPALIVFVAMRGAFGPPPDAVFSGINQGPNTGQAVLHSGTVGAALTGVSHGVPALAVSLAGRRPTHWDTAAEAAAPAVGWFRDHALGPATGDRPFVLNVNVPDIPADRLRGLRPAGLASFGAVQAAIGERGRGWVTVGFTDVDDRPAPETDVALLADGWATATALDGPRASNAVDLSTLGEPVADR